jgi:Na+-translocating ferredoxin:NAD+ oxidoreductase subunit D
MQFSAYSSPHTAHSENVTRVMAQVLLALLPGIVAMTWYFGWGVVINIVIASATAVAAEAAFIRLRGRDPRPAVSDLSAVVTAVLFAVSIPPLLPWWLTVGGMLFAIIVVKQLYGGLGFNPFNPAMAAYVLLLISYPTEMTSWLPPRQLATHSMDFFTTLGVIFTSHLPQGLSWDAVTMATPLDEMRTQLDLGRMISEIRQSPLWGDFGGVGTEWVANWFLLGGIFLLWRRVISWHIPVSMLAALLIMATAWWLAEPEAHPFPGFHLFSGGVIVGAFFIATDPVTTVTTRRGQLIFGALIGVLVYVIRSWGGYPDAVAFAVLLMNMAAPTIGYYTQPRIYGEVEGKDGA